MLITLSGLSEQDLIPQFQRAAIAEPLRLRVQHQVAL
jgi:hypothetical protein